MSRFTRKTVLALAALATLGTLALATNDASARPGGGGMRVGGGGDMHIGGVGMRRVGGGIGFRRIGGVGFRRIDPGFIRHPRFHPRFVHHHHRHWHWRYGWRRHYWLPPVITTGVATGVVAAAPTWNRCSCLTKEYTPEGAVVFKDLCTKEIAMNPPAAQPTAYDPSQDPTAVGALPPQAYAQPAVPTSLSQVR